VPDPDETITDNDTRKETRRLLICVCIVAVVVLLLPFTPLRQWLAEARDLKARISGYGWMADAVFVLVSTAGIALGVPRLALCGLGAMLFGFLEGVLTAQFAGVAGSYGAFLLARVWAPKDWVRRKLAGSERLHKLLAHPSIGSIFVARQLPVPGLVPNVLLGVLNTRHSTFLVGTFLGYLPSNIPVALAGSSMGKDSLAKAIGQVSLSMLALAVFSVLIMWVRRRYSKE
jgi:uncharacterized membrane protein YdjX (TVP38/TMEM64 family)